MFSIIPDLYAMAPQSGGGAGGPGMMGQFVLFGAIFAIFFLLVIRPQQKKAKKHREMVESIGRGDRVITASGIHGKVNKYFDDKDYLLLEIAEKTVIKIQKNQIADVIKSSNQKQVTEKAEEKAEENKEEKTEE